MKLLELTGYRNQQHLTLAQFLAKVDSKSGARGAVIRGTNFVYKVWVEDPAYEAFIKLTEKYQQNSWFPKILKPVKDVTLPLNKPLAFTGKVKVVKLEKLTPATPKFQVLIKLLDIALKSKPDKDAIAKQLTDLQLDQTEFDEMLIALTSIKGSFNNDLHLSNWMMRGNQPVIIDPFAAVTGDKELTIDDISGLSISFYGEKFSRGNPI